MEQTIQEKLAYMAGIVDGEGCICMTKGRVNANSNKVCYKVRLTVCSTSIVLLDWLVNNFGGNYVLKPIKKGMELKHSKAYNWNIHCEKAGNLLSMILPYLVIKKKQAELVLAYRKIQELNVKSYPGHFVVPVSLREEIFVLLKFLNKRGPESVETNTPDFNNILMKIESELIRNSERKVSDDFSIKRDQFIFNS